jgi:DNA-binding Xre family transcriptional regulator
VEALENNFRQLLTEKEIREDRRITPTMMSEETGIAYTTAQRWFEGNVSRYDDNIIKTICDWLPASSGQLLSYCPPQLGQTADPALTSALIAG